MYSVRWLILFQHCYQRPGHEKFTEHFQKMIKGECDRKTGEDILVENLLALSSPEADYPILQDSTTMADYNLALRIQHWTQKGTPLIRGKEVPPIPADEDDEGIFAEGGSDSDSIQDMDLSISRSHVAENILGQDILATQQSQLDTAQYVRKSSDHKYQVANGMLQDILKVVEDDPVGYQDFIDMLGKFKQMAVTRTVAAQTASSSKEGDGSINDELGEGIEFSQTGTYKPNANIKRKRGAY
jgi:hypothetical protein